MRAVAIGIMRAIIVILGIVQRRFLGGMLRFLAQQRFAVFLGDLVIIRVDFGKGEEAVAVAAIIDERGLERGFDPRHLGEIDIPLELFPLGRFEIKFLDTVAFDDGHAGLFPVARVDQHAHGHSLVSGRGRGRRRSSSRSGRRRDSRRAARGTHGPQPPAMVIRK